MRVVVLADTHVSDSAPAGRLPPVLYAALRHTDLILHAGDVVGPELLAELETYAPVHAVLGNNDHPLVGVLPETVEIEVGGVRIAMIHDSGARDGREARMRRRFPDAAIVIYGHSHLPEDRIGADRQRLFNPGSPTQRRRAPHRTYGRLNVAGGRIRRHEIVDLPPA
jgi:uncharacterized protein